MLKKIAAASVIIITLILLSGLLAPRSNPPVTHQVKWDSPKTQAQFMKSCADCHSHETKWPWYAYVGPVAFVITDHVNDGRKHFNISVAAMGDADESGEEVEKGKMPTEDYLALHSEAVIPTGEIETFVAGLHKTFGKKQRRKSKDGKAHNHDHH